jgi:hypothetical protein
MTRSLRNATKGLGKRTVRHGASSSPQAHKPTKMTKRNHKRRVGAHCKAAWQERAHSITARGCGVSARETKSQGNIFPYVNSEKKSITLRFIEAFKI